MSPLTLYSFILIVLFIGSVSTAYDVAVYGATPGGIAAAITAARASSTFSIALIEPTSNIGGMSAAGGIGLRDLAYENTRKLMMRTFKKPSFYVYLYLIDYS